MSIYICVYIYIYIYIYIYDAHVGPGADDGDDEDDRAARGARPPDCSVLCIIVSDYAILHHIMSYHNIGYTIP